MSKQPISADDTQLIQISDPVIAKTLRQILEGQEAMQATLKDAFPGGDSAAHRRYHEEIILQMQDRRKMRGAITEQVIKGSVWALLVTVGAAVWQYLKDHLR